MINQYTWKDKLLSGRLYLTLTASISFLFFVFSFCYIMVKRSDAIQMEHIILLVTNFALVIQNVFNSYFNKRRLNERE